MLDEVERYFGGRHSFSGPPGSPFSLARRLNLKKPLPTYPPVYVKRKKKDIWSDRYPCNVSSGLYNGGMSNSASNNAKNPSVSERLDRVHYAQLLVIQREQELAKAARAPLLKYTQDVITTAIEGLL